MGIFSDSVDPHRAKGWHLVPITSPGQKSPVVPGYTGKSGAMADDATYEKWKDEYADNNFGIRLDHGWVGIDVDDYAGKNGWANLEQFAVDHTLPALAPTYSTSSRTGYSGIYMFRYAPLLMKGRAFLTELGGGIEIIQFNHRYAVAPPSIHPDTHMPYQWRGLDREPISEIPHVNAVVTLPLPWLMAISVKHDGPAGSTMTASTLPTKVECERWLADQRGDGMPWEGLLRSITDRIEAKALEGTRYAAMRWATALVVGDIAGTKLPGRAIYELERVCRLLYEMPPGHKVAKTFAGTKQRDFWNLVAGAMLHYEDGGEWRDRIEDDIEAGAIAEHFRTEGLPMDDVVVEPVEPEETSAVVPNPATAPGDIVLPFHALDPIEPDEVMAADGAGLVVADDGAEVVARAEAVTRAAAAAAAAAASMDPRKRDVFIEIVREWAASFRATESNGSVADTELSTVGLGGLVAKVPPTITFEMLEAWGREADARIRSRDSLTNIFDPVLRPHWIEGDWLPKGSLVTVIAKSSVGKTLFLVDMACRLAIGAPWHGEFTEQTSVLYLAFESPFSVYDRIAAWSQWPDHHALLDECPDADLVQWRGELPTPRRLFVTNMTGVNLRTEGGVREILSHMESIAASTGQFPGVVIIDTLAQAFGGGEENDNGVMGEFVINMQSVLRAEEHGDTTINIAHHPVKTLGDGEHGTSRGAGALTAAVDVEISLAKVMVGEGDDRTATPLIEAKRMKARDGEVGITLTGMKQVVGLVGNDGMPVVNPRSGVQKSNVVWTVATDADRLDTGAAALAHQAENEAIVRAEMERISDVVLTDIGWFPGTGEKIPKSGYSVKAFMEKWKDSPMNHVGTGAMARSIATEVIEKSRAEAEAEAEALAAEAEGVD